MVWRRTEWLIITVKGEKVNHRPYVIIFKYTDGAIKAGFFLIQHIYWLSELNVNNSQKIGELSAAIS